MVNAARFHFLENLISLNATIRFVILLEDLLFCQFISAIFWCLYFVFICCLFSSVLCMLEKA